MSQAGAMLAEACHRGFGADGASILQKSQRLDPNSVDAMEAPFTEYKERFAGSH